MLRADSHGNYARKLCLNLCLNLYPRGHILCGVLEVISLMVLGEDAAEGVVDIYLCPCHEITILVGDSSSPKSANTWFTLSSCTVGFPRSSSLTKRTPTPLRSASSTWVRPCSFLFAWMYSPIFICSLFVPFGYKNKLRDAKSPLSGTNIHINIIKGTERDDFFCLR